MALGVLLDRAVLLEYGPGIDPANQVFTTMEAEALEGQDIRIFGPNGFYLKDSPG